MFKGDLNPRILVGSLVFGICLCFWVEWMIFEPKTEAIMPDRYTVGRLMDGSEAWAIYRTDDPDLDRPLMCPIYDREAADDLAAAMNSAAAERNYKQANR